MRWGRYRIYALPEGEPELPGHGAVEDEVDHAVHQGHHVHQLQDNLHCFLNVNHSTRVLSVSPSYLFLLILKKNNTYLTNRIVTEFKEFLA